MPRAVRLEMAPNVIVKQDTPKLDDFIGSKVLLFSQGPGCSEEFISRFCRRMDGVEVENVVIDTVLIFSVTYGEIAGKV
ncbi:hypothetical protein CgunFtcFv8_008413 [Champsocephalus gunnari]|uniref:Uncharacterized protein n=1 Tax=Champsocephalus gunnari TaxID=52237 RepID=A0AAN8D3S6_CHAGU|nr:hypothetical protein CgunFtcFv8_008413 [Champsocephalus gunnari]